MAKKHSAIDKLIPTRLLDPSERTPVPEAKKRSKRFRFLYVLRQSTALIGGNALLRLRGHKTAAAREERILEYLQRLGMLWIRVAQTLILRSSKLSTPFGLRLLDLRDQGGACPFSKIREIISKELGKDLKDVFDRFDESPFSATTVSQIHRARLRSEQVWVAVKVQQSGAEEIFDRDLVLFRRVIGLIKLFNILEGMRWDDLCHELNDIKMREMNYHYEVAALDTLGKNLTAQPVHVPRIFRQYCRKRILVMKFIRGALLSDLIALQKKDPERVTAWLKENDIDLRTLGRRLFHAIYRQVFENNFFHGDMNTGNIILLRHSRAAVIECRSAGSLESESLEKQRVFLRSLAEGEYVTAAEIYFLLATRLPRVDLNMVKERLVRIWRVWAARVYVEDLPYEKKSLTYLTGQVNGVVQDAKFSPLWSFSKLTCTWAHLDNALAGLSPGLNYLEELCLYFHEALMRETADNISRLPSRLASSLVAMHDMPKRLDEFTMFKEALMRRQAQVVQGSASKMDAFIAACFGFSSFLVLILGIFLFMVFLIHHQGVHLEPLLGPQLSWAAARVPPMGLGPWLGVFAFFSLLYGFFRVQKTRFGRREFGSPANNTTIET
ncbi:MAG: AarF/ABC1/UbiB kinase family protein [Candidatus Aminicenantes bacterium]|nr:AarF/ABC1/UbiB kinase family protein [Candidatus Aminicenantes bacterium]